MGNNTKFSFNRVFLTLTLLLPVFFVFSNLGWCLPQSWFNYPVINKILGFVYGIAMLYLLLMPIPLFILGLILSVKKTQTRSVHYATILLLFASLVAGTILSLGFAEGRHQRLRKEGYEKWKQEQILNTNNISDAQR